MKHFRKLFTFLFILSIFVGVIHELDSHHSHDGTCEICVVAHTPALLSDEIIISKIDSYFEPFYASFVNISPQVSIPLKSRSPPIS